MLIAIAIYLTVNVGFASEEAIMLSWHNAMRRVIIRRTIYNLLLALPDFIVDKWTGKSIVEHSLILIEKVKGEL